ncbi:MAG: ABC-type transport auxiliary lipoprotein family protein [Novosphingobium sp.]|nr:ABC-type transport auxiliary lipoprotein family protein [Novosphingobium sp.]
MKREHRPVQAATIRGFLSAMAAGGMLALLSGCVSLGPKVPDQLISLTPAVAAPAGAPVGETGKAILVLAPEADRAIDVQRVPVRIDSASIAYLQDALWVERPARQFRRLVAEAIRAKSGRLVLEGGEAEYAAGETLSGRLLDMGYDARSRSVIVAYDAIRSSADGTMATRRFTASVPDVEAKAAPVARALNQAANDVAGQVADWVN